MDNGNTDKIKKIIFFVRPELDSFLDDVIKGLSCEYETKKVIITEFSQIDEGMQWADLCWFEWCDDLIACGSKSSMSLNKKIICRLHSYEAFTDYPFSANWDMIDSIIFVGEHIREYAINKFKISKDRTAIIPNGINMEKFTFRRRAKGYNVAFVGLINYKKGPMLLLQVFKAIYDKNPQYKLYIAGLFQDERYILYFSQMIDEMGLKNNIEFCGWQNDLNSWLEDKDFILCTSVLESQNLSIMQAMSKGIKPLIHNFAGAKNIYPEKYLFNTIKEAADMLDDDINPDEYRKYIYDNYSLDKTTAMLKKEISSVFLNCKCLPPVSIIITVYNREKYIKQTIENVLLQSYTNIELIVVNDGSSDNSENIIRSFSDSRLKYYYKNNSGQLDALKFGISKASGKYITRVDSDDMIEASYVETCVKNMIDGSNPDFVYCDFEIIDENGHTTGNTNFKDYMEPSEIIMDMFTGFASVIPDVGFWKKEYAENVINNYCNQNMPFYIDNIYECKFVHIKKPLYLYRKHRLNFASASEANSKLVVLGKICFLDFIIRKYFIQMDVYSEFKKNKAGYFRIFALNYIRLGHYYKEFGREFSGMFLKEASYWFKKYCSISEDKSEMDEIGEKIKLEDAEINFSEEIPYETMNKRILIASADDPMNGKAAGGKHVHIYLLQKGLSYLKIPSYLAAYEYDGNALINLDELKKQFKISSSDFINIIKPDFIYLVYAIQKQLEDKIRKILLKYYISHINCHDVIAAYAARNVLNELGLDIPVITTVHGYFTSENKDYGILGDDSLVYNCFIEYEKKAYEISDKIIAVDSRIKGYLLNMLNNEDNRKISMIKNAIDISDFNQCCNETDFLSDNIFFIPRRLVPKNGVIYSVKAAHELVKSGFKDFIMLIAGSGIEKEAIEGYIKEYQLQNHVRLLGNIPHDEIVKYYKISKIVLIPSIPSNNVEEATSLSALEGMAAGRIVIASAIGGLKEIITNGVNGYLVKPGDPKELAGIIETIAKMNKEDYFSIGRNARSETEAKYGNINHTAEYLRIFDEA